MFVRKTMMPPRSHTTAPCSSKASLALGGDIGLFGLGGDASWMGILGGPIVGIGARPFSVPISLELSAHLDFGRIPVCNLWGLCLRFLGAFPLVQAGMSHAATESIAAVAACGVRIIQTLAWTGVSVEPAVSARIFW